MHIYTFFVVWKCIFLHFCPTFTNVCFGAIFEFLVRKILRPRERRKMPSRGYLCYGTYSFWQRMHVYASQNLSFQLFKCPYFLILW